MDIFAIPHSATPTVSFASGVTASRPPGNQRHTLILALALLTLSVLIFVEVK